MKTGRDLVVWGKEKELVVKKNPVSVSKKILFMKVEKSP